MRSSPIGGTLVLILLAILCGAGCSRSRAERDDTDAVTELMTALQPMVTNFEASQTTNCQTDRLRQLGLDSPMLADVDVARAYYAGTPAPSRFPLAATESLPTGDVARLDAQRRKKAAEAARFVMTMPIWALYHVDELDLPAVGMTGDQPKSFTGGKVSLTINLVDRAAATTLCTVKIDAENARTVKVVTKGEGVVRGPGTDLVEQARRNLEQRLQRLR